MATVTLGILGFESSSISAIPAGGAAGASDSGACYIRTMTDQEIIAQQKQTIARAKYVVKAQMEEIEKLRAEIDLLLSWIRGDRDALVALQEVYNDPEQSPANRVKAASSALPYERPRVVITGYANMTSLAQRLDSAPLRLSSTPAPARPPGHLL